MNEEILKATIKNAARAALKNASLPKGYKLEPEPGKKGKYILTHPDGTKRYFKMLPDDIIAFARREDKELKEYEAEKGQRMRAREDSL